MKVYQCLRCGLTFKTKRQAIAHLRNTEKINKFIVEYFYQVFDTSSKYEEKVI